MTLFLQTISIDNIQRGSTACKCPMCLSQLSHKKQMHMKNHHTNQSSVVPPENRHALPEHTASIESAWPWPKLISTHTQPTHGHQNFTTRSTWFSHWTSHRQPGLLIIKFPCTTKSHPTPKLLRHVRMLVALEAMDQLRQSGPQSERHPGWSINTANKAVLGWTDGLSKNFILNIALRPRQKALRAVEVMDILPALHSWCKARSEKQRHACHQTCQTPSRSEQHWTGHVSWTNGHGFDQCSWANHDEIKHVNLTKAKFWGYVHMRLAFETPENMSRKWYCWPSQGKDEFHVISNT